MRNRIRKLFPRLRKMFRPRSLSDKLLLPSIGLILILVLISTALFIIGTNLTKQYLFEQEVGQDGQRVQQIINQRVEDVQTSARLLANDPTLRKELNKSQDGSLNLINQRAVIIRERFNLDVVQIFNENGTARTNLLTTSLYRQSSLLKLAEAGKTILLAVDGHLLIVSSSQLPDATGTVITALDMHEELFRILKQELIPGNLGIQYQEIQVGTSDNLPYGQESGQVDEVYLWRNSINLLNQQVDLLVTRETGLIQSVTSAGLTVMVISMIIVSSLLVIAGIFVTRSIAQPIHKLSEAAYSLAEGDLNSQVNLTEIPSQLAIGKGDEIEVLTNAFNHMVVELRALYNDLDNKVKERTKQLTAAADVARAASSSLDLNVVLRTSVDLIRDRFGFYHAAVFIIEPDSNVAVLRETSSENELMLKAWKHRLRVGSKSLVGRATALREPIIAQDVTKNPDYYQNPLLPDTRSEAVFPLLIGESVIGALDVQSTQPDSFPPDMVSILFTLADQLAISVHNARLYEIQKNNANRLAEVDNLKNQFMENISKELKAPLVSITGYSELMLKGVDGKLNEKQIDDLIKINSSANHLTGLIQDLMDVSNPSSGTMELVYEQVSLSSLVDGVFVTITALLKNKAVTLLKAMDDSIPPVSCDKSRIRQVLLNLLTNAAKFTENGYIIVRARHLSLINPENGKENNYVEISVADTGLGIAREDLDDVFKPFNQKKKAGNAAYREGTGLGLSICRTILEMHGGRIWVDSTPGQGSTFTFTLPVNQPSVKVSVVKIMEEKYVS